MKISLIIAFYKNIPALSLILRALDGQSYRNFEVVVAEDDNNPRTVAFLEAEKHKHAFGIKHLFQAADRGFRKNEMLNRAIRQANGDLVVFLDGDTIPHKHFLKTYAKRTTENTALFGRRVMLDRQLTEKLTETKELSLLKTRNLLFSGAKRIRYSLYLPFITSFRETGIWGCNWAIFKKHLFAVNGFDEDYQKAGYGEDVDIEWRLKKHGIQLRSVRYGAIVYHLYHERNYSDADLRHNFKLLESKKTAGKVFCDNGLVQQK